MTDNHPPDGGRVAVSPSDGAHATRPPTIVSPTQPPASPPGAHADSYAARLAQATADAEDFFAEGMALLGDSETRAPAQTEGTTAPTTEGGATASAPPAHGPEGTTLPQPATATSPPPTGQAPEDATQANSQRRAESHQAILQREVENLKAQVAAKEAENAKLLTDNRVLFGQHEQVREIARRQGAVRYEDVDQAITDSAIREHQRQQAEEQEVAQQQAVSQQQNAGWIAAIGERNAAATSAREQTIARILAAANETQQPLSYEKAAELVKSGYEDPAVLADLDLWRSNQIPTHIANQRINQAYSRIFEISKAKLVQQAVQTLRDDGAPLPQYDRTQPYGTGSSGLPANYSSMTYDQRLRYDLEAANEQFAADQRRLLGSG